MGVSISDEITIFLFSCLSGALMLFFYDLIFCVCKQRDCSIVVINVLDGIVITVSCAILIFVTFSVSHGIVRFFEFFGAFLGAVLYKLMLSRPLCFIFRKIIEWIHLIFKIFFKILLTPLKITYKMINKCISGLFCPVFALFRKIGCALFYKLRKTASLTGKVIRKT